LQVSSTDFDEEGNYALYIADNIISGSCREKSPFPVEDTFYVVREFGEIVAEGITTEPEKQTGYLYPDIMTAGNPHGDFYFINNTLSNSSCDAAFGGRWTNSRLFFREENYTAGPNASHIMSFANVHVNFIRDMKLGLDPSNTEATECVKFKLEPNLLYPESVVTTTLLNLETEFTNCTPPYTAIPPLTEDVLVFY